MQVLLFKALYQLVKIVMHRKQKWKGLKMIKLNTLIFIENEKY